MKKKKIDNLILNRNIEILNENIKELNENIKELNNKNLSLKEKSNKNIVMFLNIVAFLISGDIFLINFASKYITMIGIIISVLLMIYFYFYFYIETFKK